MYRNQNYADRIVPIMLEHHIIMQEESELMKEFLNEDTGDHDDV